MGRLYLRPRIARSVSDFSTLEARGGPAQRTIGPTTRPEDAEDMIQRHVSVRIALGSKGTNVVQAWLASMEWRGDQRRNDVCQLLGLDLTCFADTCIQSVP